MQWVAWVRSHLDARLKILYLSSWFPYPPDNGSRARAFHILKQLSRRHTVSVLALTDPDSPASIPDELAALSNHIQTYPRPAYHPRGLSARMALLSATPRFLANTFDVRLDEKIGQTVVSDKPDVILAGELSMAVYAARHPHSARIFDDAEAGLFANQRSQANVGTRLRHTLTWWKYGSYLRRLALSFEAVTTVSSPEARLLERLGVPPAKIQILPNGIDCDAVVPPTGEYAPYTLIYPGALTYAANLDAMHYFVAEILPLVRRREPRARLSITGRTDRVAINEFSGNNAVSFTGYVGDVRPLIRDSAVCVVPIRVGGGTRVKILEAMLLGTTVVSTSKGAEGLDVRDGEHLLLANSPEAFAEAILRLFNDPPLRARLARAAQDHVCTYYSWQLIGQELDALVTRVASPD